MGSQHGSSTASLRRTIFGSFMILCVLWHFLLKAHFFVQKSTSCLRSYWPAGGLGKCRLLITETVHEGAAVDRSQAGGFVWWFFGGAPRPLHRVTPIPDIMGWSWFPVPPNGSQLWVFSFFSFLLSHREAIQWKQREGGMEKRERERVQQKYRRLTDNREKPRRTQNILSFHLAFFGIFPDKTNKRRWIGWENSVKSDNSTQWSEEMKLSARRGSPFLVRETMSDENPISKHRGGFVGFVVATVKRWENVLIFQRATVSTAEPWFPGSPLKGLIGRRGGGTRRKKYIKKNNNKIHK